MYEELKNETLANAIINAYARAENYLKEKAKELTDVLKFTVSFNFNTDTIEYKITVQPIEKKPVILKKNGNKHYMDTNEVSLKDLNDIKYDEKGEINPRYLEQVYAMKCVIDRWKDIKEKVEYSIRKYSINKYLNFDPNKETTEE